MVQQSVTIVPLLSGMQNTTTHNAVKLSAVFTIWPEPTVQRAPVVTRLLATVDDITAAQWMAMLPTLQCSLQWKRNSL